jgi:restriction system protein
MALRQSSEVALYPQREALDQSRPPARLRRPLAKRQERPSLETASTIAKALAALIFLSLCVYLFFLAASAYVDPALLTVTTSSLAMLSAGFGVTLLAGASRRKQKLYATTERIIVQHAKTLQLEKSKRTIHDRYGRPDHSDWEREKRYFFETQILPAIDPSGAELDRTAVEQLCEHASRSIDGHVQGASDKLLIPDLKTGYDYERYCKQALEKHGWAVLQTPKSRDQGADLIAEKGGHRVVLQCKFYTQAVGNKAVQEVAAAQAYQKAKTAAVVSNRGFTRPAEQLAKATNVLLLHHDGLLYAPVHTRLSHLPLDSALATVDRWFMRQAGITWTGSILRSAMRW